VGLRRQTREQLVDGAVGMAVDYLIEHVGEIGIGPKRTRLDPGACRDKRDHTAGTEGKACRARRSCQRRRGVAHLQTSQDHAQKKTTHASEQNRPDILTRRWAGYDSQLDLDSERLVCIDEI
jgi:hypothetical protein